ncbi:MAG: MerR family transcriptional regulator [Desulfuromonadaceae bacterium]|nr:MerR family transcriptional regulator [Desulfuromonadaceae bacterium]
MASLVTGKMFYKIGEVAEVAGVKTSVLRFWESEFPFLKPVKSNSGQRLYSMNEVELVLQVKHLLYDEKYTIEGVKKRMKAKGKVILSESPPSNTLPKDYREVLKTVQNDLLALRELL